MTPVIDTRIPYNPRGVRNLFDDDVVLHTFDIHLADNVCGQFLGMRPS